MKHLLNILCLSLVIICIIFSNQVIAEELAIEKLVYQLQDLDNVIRDQAEIILVDLGNLALPALNKGLNTLDSEYDLLRRAIVRILGKIGTEEAVPSLLETISNDPNPLVRATAINSLDRIDNLKPEALSIIQTALQDESSEVKIAAADALRKVGKEAVNSQIDLLLLTGSADPQVAWAAQRAVMTVAPGILPIQADTINQIIHRLPHPTWQDLAITVLARAQDSVFEPIMEVILNEQLTPMIRVPAIQVLKAVSVNGSVDLAPLQELLNNTDQPFLVQVAITDLLDIEESNPLANPVFNNKIAIRVENLEDAAGRGIKVEAIFSIPAEQHITQVNNLTVWDEQGKQIPSEIKALSYWDKNETLVRNAIVSFYPDLEAYERAVYFVSLESVKPVKVDQVINIDNNGRTKVSITQQDFLVMSDINFEQGQGWVRQMIVAADGSGDFTNIQAAIDAVPENNQERVLIYIKNGTYHEKLLFPSNKPFISLIGEDKETTILTFNETAANIQFSPDELYKTWGAASSIILADDFTAENVTFRNSSLKGTGQAQAVRVDGDRIIFNNCKFISHQDTVFANGDGRQYYYNCYIEGDVDFIYGSATAVFENCDIVNNRKTGGYITAASTPQEREFGLVFLNSRIIGDVNPGSVWLGRPWRPYSHTAFINCYMSEVVQPTAWHNWGNVANEATARYEEYSSSGPGANPHGRVSWSSQLTEAEVSKYTVENILKGTDNWLPTIKK